MNFDEIYKIAIWVDRVSHKYGVPILTITELFSEISKTHAIDETKDIIEKGFIIAKGETDGKEISSNTGD